MIIIIIYYPLLTRTQVLCQMFFSSNLIIIIKLSLFIIITIINIIIYYPRLTRTQVLCQMDFFSSNLTAFFFRDITGAEESCNVEKPAILECLDDFDGIEVPGVLLDVAEGLLPQADLELS